jgi:hypothetical protein
MKLGRAHAIRDGVNFEDHFARERNAISWRVSVLEAD